MPGTERPTRRHVAGVTVNGSGGDILSPAAIDGEFHPTALDPRVNRPRDNATTKRNTIKGRSGGKRLTTSHAPTRNKKGQFLKKVKALPLEDIRRRGMYGY